LSADSDLRQPPRRIAILGCSGSGKSTLAVALGACLGLPVFHLDALHWQLGWQEPSPEEWRAAVAALAAREAWIIDGNYAGTLDLRLARADAAIFLDFPRWRCYWGVVRRWWRHRGGTRPDMAPGCPEQLDLEFLRWIWGFRRRSRPGLLARLERLPPRVATVTLRSPKAVATWLADLRAGRPVPE